MSPELGRLYRLDEFQAGWAAGFQRVVQHFPLPTEIVVAGPELVLPRVARAYGTVWHAYRGRAVTYDWLYHLYYQVLGQPFPGLWGVADAVVMVEVVGDHGPDGHIDYQIEGFRFVPQAALQLTTARWVRRQQGLVKLPEVMLEQDFDGDRKNLAGGA